MQKIFKKKNQCHNTSEEFNEKTYMLRDFIRKFIFNYDTLRQFQ